MANAATGVTDPATAATEPRLCGRRLLADKAEQENFDAAINSLVDLKASLDKERSAKQLPPIHTEVGGRDASLVTVHVSGEFSHQRYVGVMWQTTNSPPKFVCVTLFASVTGGFVMHRCSCNLSSQEACWHRNVVSENEKLSTLVRSLLLEDDASKYFGDHMPVSSWDGPDLDRA